MAAHAAPRSYFDDEDDYDEMCIEMIDTMLQQANSNADVGRQQQQQQQQQQQHPGRAGSGAAPPPPFAQAARRQQESPPYRNGGVNGSAFGPGAAAGPAFAGRPVQQQQQSAPDNYARRLHEQQRARQQQARGRPEPAGNGGFAGPSTGVQFRQDAPPHAGAAGPSMPAFGGGGAVAAGPLPAGAPAPGGFGGPPPASFQSGAPAAAAPPSWEFDRAHLMAQLNEQSGTIANLRHKKARQDQELFKLKQALQGSHQQMQMRASGGDPANVVDRARRLSGTHYELAAERDKFKDEAEFKDHRIFELQKRLAAAEDAVARARTTDEHGNEVDLTALLETAEVSLRRERAGAAELREQLRDRDEQLREMPAAAASAAAAAAADAGTPSPAVAPGLDLGLGLMQRLQAACGPDIAAIAAAGVGRPAPRRSAVPLGDARQALSVLAVAPAGAPTAPAALELSAAILRCVAALAGAAAAGPRAHSLVVPRGPAPGPSAADVALLPHLLSALSALVEHCDAAARALYRGIVDAERRGPGALDALGKLVAECASPRSPARAPPGPAAAPEAEAVPPGVLEAIVLAFCGLLSSLASVLVPRELEAAVLGRHGVLRDRGDPSACPRVLVDLLRCPFVAQDAGGRSARARADIQTRVMRVMLSLAHEPTGVFFSWLHAGDEEDTGAWRPWEYASSVELVHAVSACLLPPERGEGQEREEGAAGGAGPANPPGGPSSGARRGGGPGCGALSENYWAGSRWPGGRLEVASLGVDFLAQLVCAQRELNDPGDSAVLKLYRPVPDQDLADAGLGLASPCRGGGSGSMIVRNVFALMDEVCRAIGAAAAAAAGGDRVAATVLQHALVFLSEIVNLMHDLRVGKLDPAELPVDVCGGVHASEMLTRVSSAMAGVSALRYHASTSHLRRCGSRADRLVGGGGEGGAGAGGGHGDGGGDDDNDDDVAVGRVAEEAHDALIELQQSFEILQPLGAA